MAFHVNNDEEWMRKIRIYSNHAKQCVCLADILSTTTTNLHFNLHGCTLGLLKTFLNNVSKNPAIQSLHVSMISPVDRERVELLADMMNVRPIKELYLLGGISATHAELGDIVLDTLYGKLLPANMPRTLSMRMFRKSIRNSDTYKHLQKSTTLEVLNITLAQSSDIEFLAKIISLNPNLRILRSNLLRQTEPIASVTKALCLLENFQEFIHNLNHGNTEQAWLTFLEHLPYLRTLRHLSLECRNIPEVCSRALFDSIRTNQTVVFLLLNDMSLNETQLFEFSHAIAENTMLSRLFVSGECFSLANIHHIAYFIENNKSLEELNLNLHRRIGLFNPAFKQILVEAISRNQRLTKVTCPEIIDEHFKSDISNITRRNASLSSLLLTHLDTTLMNITTERDIRSYFSSSCPNPSPISSSSFSSNNDEQSPKRLRK